MHKHKVIFQILNTLVIGLISGITLTEINNSITGTRGEIAFIIALFVVAWIWYHTMKVVSKEIIDAIGENS